MGMNDFPYQNIKAAIAQLEQQEFSVIWNPMISTITLSKVNDRYTLTPGDLINLYLTGQLNESGLSRFKQP